jgi:hypothetical protein
MMIKDINSRSLIRDEIYNWDIVANHFFGIKGITEEQKELVRNAFLFLKIEFGENYLKEIEPIHPMDFHINNYVLVSRLWFVDLAENIKRLKPSINYKALHRRLRDPKKFPEAFSVLEIAIKFLKTGFMIEFDPQVKVNGKPKEPDLKIINPHSDESFYCEVSVLNTSVVEQNAMKTELGLFNEIIFSSPLGFAGKVERILTEDEIKETSNKIIELRNKVEKTGFGELVIKNIITLGLASEENTKKLMNWAEEHNCEVGNFEQPYYESNELQRMKTKINEKRKQMPYDKPNLIMIYDNDFFYRCGDPFYVINELEKWLAKYNNVAGVVLRGKVMATIEPLIAKIKQHTYIQKYQYDNYAEQYLIIWNVNSERKFNDESNKSIIDSILFY